MAERPPSSSASHFSSGSVNRTVVRPPGGQETLTSVKARIHVIQMLDRANWKRNVHGEKSMLSSPGGLLGPHGNRGTDPGKERPDKARAFADVAIKTTEGVPVEYRLLSLPFYLAGQVYRILDAVSW